MVRVDDVVARRPHVDGWQGALRNCGCDKRVGGERAGGDAAQKCGKAGRVHGAIPFGDFVRNARGSSRRRDAMRRQCGTEYRRSDSRCVRDCLVRSRRRVSGSTCRNQWRRKLRGRRARLLRTDDRPAERGRLGRRAEAHRCFDAHDAPSRGVIEREARCGAIGATQTVKTVVPAAVAAASRRDIVLRISCRAVNRRDAVLRRHCGDGASGRRCLNRHRQDEKQSSEPAQTQLIL